tara:strand:+ start:132 stop:476 length:345 start_codon:yes stop_codon:yes gene_type:complete
MVFTRKQYLTFKGDQDEKATMHQAFYAQFANDKIVNIIAGKFSPEELIQAYETDKHLNAINLRIWDDLARYTYPWIDQDLLKETDQIWGLNSGVCTCKAAAKILISRILSVPVV